MGAVSMFNSKLMAIVHVLIYFYALGEFYYLDRSVNLLDFHRHGPRGILYVYVIYGESFAQSDLDRQINGSEEPSICRSLVIPQY